MSPSGAPAPRTPRELRRFGLVVGGAFVVLAFVSWWRGHTIPPRVMGTLAVLLLVPGLLAPRVLAPVERVWMRFAEVLGHINARIIMTVVYYLVITPVGIVRRLIQDPLDRRMRDGRPSVWVRRPQGPTDPARYRQPF